MNGVNGVHGVNGVNGMQKSSPPERVWFEPLATREILGKVSSQGKNVLCSGVVKEKVFP